MGFLGTKSSQLSDTLNNSGVNFVTKLKKSIKK